jgi:hypothetical protein
MIVQYDTQELEIRSYIDADGQYDMFPADADKIYYFNGRKSVHRLYP